MMTGHLRPRNHGFVGAHGGLNSQAKGTAMGAESERVAGFGHLEDGLRAQGTEWYRWGPYVSERQWGTVREDYSADGNAWDNLPHDQARSRAYRWGEDGLAGFCDVEQRLCLGLALWNGKDPILKERPFGLTGPQGNHGEDVKEYWWYLDAVPSHAWNRWRYHYPQSAYPYQDLIDTNARRSRYEPEYELLDTGAFDEDRYWITEVHYAKASPDDLLMAIQVTNAGPETATLHVLPTAWFRNTWSWDAGVPVGRGGLAGFCDVEQRLCLGLALWNGKDPILKERPFGLTGPQGNHGEDVKEYWWYLDALPSHAWNRWRYHYPQSAYPYQDLIDTNARRSRYEPEYELLDTGAFDGDRYWITEVHYAKASPDDLLMAIQVTNAGPETATLHVLPTAWFRNTWSWDTEESGARPALRASGDRTVTVDHPFAGTLELLAAAGPDGAVPQLLFCENETDFAGLYGGEAVTPYPKDGINNHVIHGAATVNPVGTGTKCAFWYQVTVPAGQTAELRLRLRPAGGAG